MTSIKVNIFNDQDGKSSYKLYSKVPTLLFSYFLNYFKNNNNYDQAAFYIGYLATLLLYLV